MAVVYFSPDVRPTLGLGIATALLLVAGMSATAARVRVPCDGQARRRRFFLVSAAGAAFLGLDELIGIHESIGLTLAHWVALAPRPERTGHLVLGGYAVAACFCFWSFRDLLRRSPRAEVLLMTSALVSVLVAGLYTVLDGPSHALTHPLQLAATGGLLVGYWLLIDALLIDPPR